MTESEASAIRFTIDHYEPQKIRPDLKNVYSNLMWTCDECNMRKGDRCPPPEARADGYEFYRIDTDPWDKHFSRNGIRVESLTETGFYTQEALDLNRKALLRLRELRERLTKCDKFVSEGIMALRAFHLDALPAHIKSKAFMAVNRAESSADEQAEKIDSVLRSYARSPYLDEDPERDERDKERAKRLADLKLLYAGGWRTPRVKTGKGAQARAGQKSG